MTTVKLNTTDATFTSTARDALVAGVHGVRDSGGLGNVIDRPRDELHDTSDIATWHQPEGVVPTPTPYVPPTGQQATVDIHVKTTGMLYGTKTVVNGALSNGQVPLKLYNDWVRWVSVYVQYLKADGTNLSLDPNGTFPNTHHAHELGLLPQIFTVLGVPIWDTNTIDVSLQFPPRRRRRACCSAGSATTPSTAAGASTSRPTPTRAAPSPPRKRCCSPRA